MGKAVHEVVFLALDLFHTHSARFARPGADEYFSRKAERWELLDRISQVVAAVFEARIEDEPRLRNKDLRLAVQLIVHAVATLGYVGWVRRGNETNAQVF